MTAYIDNIIIQGTPEEIQEFMELRDKNVKQFSFGYHDYELCTTCYSAPCTCPTQIRTDVIDFGVPDGYFSIRESGT